MLLAWNLKSMLWLKQWPLLDWGNQESSLEGVRGVPLGFSIEVMVRGPQKSLMDAMTALRLGQSGV